MLQPLPPLDPLVAFEAAARLGSFQRAAEELHLTPSAVSHRIRQLEEKIGKPLFERQHRHIALTPEGKHYYTGVHEALEQLRRVTEEIGGQIHKRLRLSVAPALGSKWLMRYLTRYQRAHPELEFQLSTSTELEPLTTGQCDVGLRYGQEEWPGLEAWKLFDETLITVCSPTYKTSLPNSNPLSEAQLLRHPLLSWTDWFTATGHAPVQAHGPQYDDALLMLEAAVSGQGVALMTFTLAAPYLAEGTLVQTTPASCPGLAFYVIAPRSLHNKPWVNAFIRWLVKNVPSYH